MAINFKEIFKKAPEEKISAALDQIENHPMMKQLRDEEQEKINLKRKEAINEIKNIEDMIESEKNLNKTEIELETINLIKLRQDLQDSERRLHSLHFDIRKKIVSLETSMFSHRKLLLSSYPELIDLFIIKMTDRADKLRNTANVTTKHFKSDRNQLIDDRIPETVMTNIPVVLKAVDFIRFAIADAEDLKMQDLSEIDVTQKLEYYWNNVPTTDGAPDSFLKPLVDISEIKNFRSYVDDNYWEHEKKRTWSLLS